MSVPKPAEQSINLVFATIALATSAFLIVSFIVFLSLGAGAGILPVLIGFPGRFLFASFHFAGLFVPVYLAAAAGLLLLNHVSLRGVVALHLGLAPFFTLALGLRLVFDPQAMRSPAPRVMADALTPIGASLVAFSATIALVALIVRFMRVKEPELAREHEVAREGAVVPEGDQAELDTGVFGVSESDIESTETEDPGLPESLTAFEHTDDHEGIDDGHTPFRDAPPLLGPRITQLLRSQRVPRVDTGEQAPELEAMEPHDLDIDSNGIVPQLSEMETETDAAAEEESEANEVFVFRRAEDAAGRRFFIAEEDESDLFDEVADELADEIDEYQDEFDEAPAQMPPKESVPRGPRKGRTAAKTPPYKVPVDGLLDHYNDGGYWEIDDETRRAGEVLRVTLEEFQIQAEVTGIRKGPVITMFEILPAPGVKLAKITNLADNIALRLAASSVRIVAPIPGKHAVGIEIPNKRRSIVSFGELLREENFTESEMAIPLAIGKDIPGDAQIIDLARTPHLLIAGATGSGKSVCVNSIICSVLYRRAPNEVKLILIDPKIVELKFYNDIPHLLTPVITDPKRAFQALQWCIYEMERRYSLLDSLGVRDIRSFNLKVKKRRIATETLPYIVVVVDEFADLMATSGKELESTLARLAAMSRAVGIHLVLATQRPSTDVITGLIKANIPSRIAFMVASKVDSRIIIDSVGAEKLLGKGDMLFTSAWDPFPFRIQGAFLSEDEVERVVEHVKTLGEPEYIDDEIFIEEDEDDVYHEELEDPLLEKAINIVVSANKASASYLQRRLKIGYNRAARLVEEMERVGIVGPQNGSKPRDILHVPEQAG